VPDTPISDSLVSHTSGTLIGYSCGAASALWAADSWSVLSAADDATCVLKANDIRPQFLLAETVIPPGKTSFCRNRRYNQRVGASRIWPAAHAWPTPCPRLPDAARGCNCSLRLLLLAFTAFAIGFPIWYRWPYEATEHGIQALPAPGDCAQASETVERSFSSLAQPATREIIAGSYAVPLIPGEDAMRISKPLAALAMLLAAMNLPQRLEAG